MADPHRLGDAGHLGGADPRPLVSSTKFDWVGIEVDAAFAEPGTPDLHGMSQVWTPSTRRDESRPSAVVHAAVATRIFLSATAGNLSPAWPNCVEIPGAASVVGRETPDHFRPADDFRVAQGDPDPFV